MTAIHYLIYIYILQNHIYRSIRAEICKRVRAERSGIVLRLNLVYSYCGRGKEVIKESDRNIVRKGRIWKENRNEGVQVLGRDDFFDLH